MNEQKELENIVDICLNCNAQRTFMYARTRISGYRVYRCLECGYEKTIQKRAKNNTQ